MSHIFTESKQNLNKMRRTFALQEKQILINFVRDNRDVLETKSNDPKWVNARKKKWEELSTVLKLKGFNRDWQRLREYYQRLKCSAKIQVIKYKKFVKETGRLPEEMPNETDWAVYDICPDDFAKKELAMNDNSSNTEENSYEYDGPYTADPMSDPISITLEPQEHFLAKLTDNKIKIEESDNSLDYLNVTTKHKRNFALEKQNDNYPIKLDDPKKRRIENLTKDITASFESELVKQKIRCELEFERERLQHAREKHQKEMRCMDLAQEKLKQELEMIDMSKMKMALELERAKLELALIKEKMKNT